MVEGVSSGATGHMVPNPSHPLCWEGPWEEARERTLTLVMRCVGGGPQDRQRHPSEGDRVISASFRGNINTKPGS